MENFPIVNSFIKKSYVKNDKVRELMQQFEEALNCNQQVRKKLEDIQPELQLLEFQASICDRVLNVALAGQNTAVKASESVETCHKQIVHLERLINEMEIGNILNYTVKCKEDQTLRELTVIKNSFDKESKQLDHLNDRSAVKNLRQLLIEKERSQNELVMLERELYNLERQNLKTLNTATDYRNKKIVQILENRKLILAIEAKSPGHVSGLDSKDEKRPSKPSEGLSNVSILLPAVDFLSNFMLFKTKDAKKPEQKKEVSECKSQQEMPGQSTLHCYSGTPPPTKKVRFVDSPELASVHVVNRQSSISTDEGSVRRVNTETDSGSGSRKSRQMAGFIEENAECEDFQDKTSEDDGQEDKYEAEETKKTKYMSANENEVFLMESDEEDCQEDKYESEETKETKYMSANKVFLMESDEEDCQEDKYGAKKTKETKYLSAEEDELVLMESDKEDSPGYEKSDAVIVEKGKSTRAEKLPHNEEAIFKGNVKKSLQKKSSNKNKVEVLSVTILPPIGPSKATFTPEDISTKFSRFKLTASQQTCCDAMDVDDCVPMQLKQDKYQKAEDELIELPMAQPTEFKHPAPMAVSPPSSDQADSMLNFSAQNCEFNDDFWLSNNNNNSNTIADPFYNL